MLEWGRGHEIQVGPDRVWKAMDAEACRNLVGPDVFLKETMLDGDGEP